MPYQELPYRRMSYDIDGTVVYYGASDELKYDILTDVASSTILTELNDEDSSLAIPNIGHNGNYNFFTFYFPEKREFKAIFSGVFRSFHELELQGSNDTTNGVDGTWDTATFPSGIPVTLNPISTDWRTNIKPVSFPEPSYKVIRMRYYIHHSGGGPQSLHLYGKKAEDQTPDDIIFCNTEGIERTSLLDWGDRPEATTAIQSFKLKNASTSKIAKDVNLQLNHTDFLLSFSENGPWTTTLDITSIAPDNLSSTIYIRNLLGEPPLTLGPKAGRCIVTVGSWT